MPALFWHDGGLYGLFGGTRSPGGLPPHDCDAIKAAGGKVIGAPGDKSALINLPVAW